MRACLIYVGEHRVGTDKVVFAPALVNLCMQGWDQLCGVLFGGGRHVVVGAGMLCLLPL